MPIPRRYGRWVRRDDYVAYLRAYAAKREILVERGIDVARIDEDEQGWRVQTSVGAMVAQDVIVATGHDREPFVPSWPGDDLFEPGIRHLSSVRRPAEFEGRDVLLVGSGNSAVEWAEQLVRNSARRVRMSVRTPPTIVPRDLLGLPLQPLSVTLRWLPTAVKDANAKAIRRLALGDLARYGLPTPAEGPYRRLQRSRVTVAIDSGFAAFVREGRVEIVPEVIRFDTTSAWLDDGSSITPDAVLVATGYRPGLEVLVGHLGVLRPDGLPVSHVHRSASGAGIWFIGYRAALEGMLRLLPGEAEVIARGIVGRDL